MAPPTRLAVFDVDGTLTRTNAIDGQCFLAAHADVLPVETIDPNWGDFTHMTDSCINREIFERVRGRPPSAAEIATVQDAFLARLADKFDEQPAYFEPVPGAPRALAFLAEELGWAVALASGGWGLTARYKLDRIGVDPDALPGAFGHEFETREEIVSAAIDRAGAAHGVDRFARIVAFGDAVWDVVTARNLGLAFIGIATGAAAAALSEAGAGNVLADYADLDGLARLLDLAEVP